MARKLFLEVSETLDHTHKYMCWTIYDLGYSDIGLGKYGFTRENYHAYVREHYPNLRNRLLSINFSAWIVCNDADETVLESKRQFLKYLANSL